MSNDQIQRTGFGPFSGLATVHNQNADLSTDPVLVVVQTVPGTTATDLTAGARSGCVYRCRILNPNAAALIAYKLVPFGATAPLAANMTANFASTGATIVPAASQTDTFNFRGNYQLYIVASGAGSSAQVVTYLDVG